MSTRWDLGSNGGNGMCCGMTEHPEGDFVEYREHSLAIHDAAQQACVDRDREWVKMLGRLWLDAADEAAFSDAVADRLGGECDWFDDAIRGER